jgi:hypothetical protein
MKRPLSSLSDEELRRLSSKVLKEIRRRKKIALANAGWTCNEGLEACLRESVKKK